MAFAFKLLGHANCRVCRVFFGIQNIRANLRDYFFPRGRMNSYARYSRFIVRSVDHIFKNFLQDASVEEVYESQTSSRDHRVAIEFRGTIEGEIIINMPARTLDSITKKMLPDANAKALKQYHADIAGEIANLITGTFANQLQFLKHDVRLLPPEIDDDPISLKALYDNINLSFTSVYGGFDIDLYYRDTRE